MSSISRSGIVLAMILKLTTNDGTSFALSLRPFSLSLINDMKDLRLDAKTHANSMMRKEGSGALHHCGRSRDCVIWREQQCSLLFTLPCLSSGREMRECGKMRETDWGPQIPLLPTSLESLCPPSRSRECKRVEVMSALERTQFASFGVGDWYEDSI